MSVLDDVLSSLRLMSQLQLLLAFLACTGYALAQGGLIGPKGRRIAWGLTLLSVVGFAFESSEWMYAAMLASFGIAGLGLFAAAAWLMSRALGFSRPRAVAEAAEFAESAEAESDFPPTLVQPSPRSLRARPQQHNNDPAPSV
jgi:hypothetical protein